MNDSIFRILILGCIAVAFAISATFRSRAQRAGGDKIDWKQEGVGLMVLLRIFGFGMWIGLLVYIINPAWLGFAALPFPEWVRWLGFVLSVSALPLLVWMFRSLGNNITDTVQTRAKAQLVVRGPYQWIRHPLYSFGGLFALGLFLMSANGLLIVLGAVAFTILLIRTPNEEAKLVETFGEDYRAYMARTARFVPGVV